MPTDDSLIGREYYVFRDSTHNLIFVEDPNLGVLLRSLLDTYEFQRLRRIRQTGLASYIYPSLEGTRFSHSLGSFAIGKRVIEALQEQQPDKKFGFPDALQIDRNAAHGFAIAAALHDIGHGPLSHTWEIVDEGLKIIDPTHLSHVHEDAGVRTVLSPQTEIGRIFSHHLTRPESYEGRVLRASVDFLRKAHPLVYLRPLLAGNLDIDRLDFIARDTKNAGVTYGSHDVDWLVRAMRFGRLPRQISNGTPDYAVTHRWVIAIDGRKGLNALVQYLRARENMYGLVYLHKTVRAANWHLTALLMYAAYLLKNGRASSRGNHLLEYLKTGVLESDLGLLEFDDADVWYTIKQLRSADDTFLKMLASRFLSRRFFKSRQVSADTASAVRRLLENGAFANRIRGRLGAFGEVSSSASCPDQLLCQLVARVDEVHFDVIGKEKEEADETWIMYRRATDLGLLRLRQYWQKTVERETGKTFYFIHFIEEIQSDMLELISKLEGVFPQINWDGEDKLSVSDEDRALAPAGFEIRQALPDRGIHKKAFVSVYVGHDGTDRFNCGEPYVLKRYKIASAEEAMQVADCVDRIYGIESQNLSRAASIRPQSGGPLWLVERLWVSDLLKLVKDTGRVLDLEFLLQMGTELFRGLAEMARKDIRHGDIKLENAGVIDGGKGRFTFVLGDFGAASATPNQLPKSDGELGTLKTRPPELLVSRDKQTIGLGSDVWALAATMFGAALGRYPFMRLEYDRSQRDAECDRLVNNLHKLKADLESTVASQLPPVLSDILAPCLLRDLADRPTAEATAALFSRALAGCHVQDSQPNGGADSPSTGSKKLYWIRALDLLDIDKYARTSGGNNEANVSESRYLAEHGKRWIPRETFEALETIARGVRTQR